MPTIESLLGPVAAVKPSVAAAHAIHAIVTTPRTNYPKTGMQSAPRALDGPDEYAYAVYAGIATLDEVRPHLVKWREDELLNRGLGSGAPKAAPVWMDSVTGVVWMSEAKPPLPVQNTIHDLQHETMQQYLSNALLLGDAVSMQAPIDLVHEISKDSIVTAPNVITGNSRAYGRGAIACLQEGSDLGLQTAATLLGKVQKQMGTTAGLAYYTYNELAGKDHASLGINYQQESTILGAFARAYKLWPLVAYRDAIYHGLTMLQQGQQPDGSFVNDAGDSDGDGAAEKSDPGKVMDLWILPHIIWAKYVLGPLWPPKAQKMLDLARGLWLATGYTKPGDVNFKWQNTNSITVGCAPEFGWRA